jgi:hypothetical protein
VFDEICFEVPKLLLQTKYLTKPAPTDFFVPFLSEFSTAVTRKDHLQGFVAISK